MFCWISIFGGLLIMMGQHSRSEALFYYFRLEDQVPENHLLRLIEKHISFNFVRERSKDSYSETGRPSIDPELLLRILLIGYLYGVTSERKLVEELRMHLAWRWFTGLGFDEEIPHHSTFSKNRHGRFQESKLFEQLFEQMVKQCVEVGLVRGDKLSVDGSFVEANAAKESRVPREQLVEVTQVHYAVRPYLQELEQQNPVEEPVHEQDQVSTTDPDSTYATTGGTPARLGYYDDYLVDNHSCVIVGVQATAARMSRKRSPHRTCSHVLRSGRDESQNRSRRILRTATESFCNGWSIAALLPTCEPATVSTARTARSTAHRAITLPAGEQQLSLPCRGTTQLRRPQYAQPHLCLYRHAQALRCLSTKGAMHQRSIPVSRHSHG